MSEDEFYEQLAEHCSAADVAFVRDLPERLEQVEPRWWEDEVPDVHLWTGVFGGRLEVWGEEGGSGTADEFFAITAEGTVLPTYDEQVLDAEPFADTFESVFGRRSGVTVADLRENWEAFSGELEDYVETFIEILRSDDES